MPNLMRLPPQRLRVYCQVLGLTRTADVKRQFLHLVFQQLEESVSHDAQPDGGHSEEEGVPAILGKPDWKQVCQPFKIAI